MGRCAFSTCLVHGPFKSVACATPIHWCVMQSVCPGFGLLLEQVAAAAPADTPAWRAGSYDSYGSRTTGYESQSNPM